MEGRIEPLLPLLGVVLNGVALEVNLSSLRNETLTALTAALVQNIATGLGGHTGAEAVLLLAGAFGRLVGALHDGLYLKCFAGWRSRLRGRKGRQTSLRRRGVKTGETLA